MNFADHNYLKNIDALTGLGNIPDAAIDLVLTDPPYNIADNNKLTKVGNKIVTTKKAWGEHYQDTWPDVESYYDWLKSYITEFDRVLKEDGSMALFLDRKYTGLITYLIEKDFNLKFRNKLYFRKVNPLPHYLRNGYRSAIEECIWFTKGKQYTFNFGEQKDMIQVYDGPIGKKATKHPNEKYNWMIDPIIRNHSNPGDVVLDAFAGSGSVLVRARKHERNAIGFEMNPEFYEMARNRCEQEQLELTFD
ncbi:DNA-methyltransferase [Paraburkholderia aromaticivorans]|uniref:DNA-methyltransferase n=1 Tax=Paraburkholderia aromaticivorans TaxID=2026199 RepID=UPI0038BA6BA2